MAKERSIGDGNRGSTNDAVLQTDIDGSEGGLSHAEAPHGAPVSAAPVSLSDDDVMSIESSYPPPSDPAYELASLVARSFHPGELSHTSETAASSTAALPTVASDDGTAPFRLLRSKPPDPMAGRQPPPRRDRAKPPRPLGREERERREQERDQKQEQKEPVPEPGTPEPGTPKPGTPEPGTPEPGTPKPRAPKPSAGATTAEIQPMGISAMAGTPAERGPEAAPKSRRRLDRGAASHATPIRSVDAVTPEHAPANEGQPVRPAMPVTAPRQQQVATNASIGETMPAAPAPRWGRDAFMVMMGLLLSLGVQQLLGPTTQDPVSAERDPAPLPTALAQAHEATPPATPEPRAPDAMVSSQPKTLSDPRARPPSRTQRKQANRTKASQDQARSEPRVNVDTVPEPPAEPEVEPTPEPPAKADPAEAPAFNRSAARSALAGASGAASGCGKGEITGVAQVSVTFARSGRVTSANVSGSLAGTPAGSCVARAMRVARVPPYSGDMVTVTKRVPVR